MKNSFRKEKVQNESFELLRAGISSQANLLVEDELGELFGGTECEPNCSRNYVNCPENYCGKYNDSGDNGSKGDGGN